MQWVKADIGDENFIRFLWKFTDDYFAEIISDKTTLKYFTSSKYRDAVVKYVKKERIEIFAALDNQINAICFLEKKRGDKKIFLMEYCVAKNLRGKGYGKKLYYELEKHLSDNGYDSIALTPTADGNRIFWGKMGFKPTGEIADNGEEIYTKIIE
ncbi:MAG TPA: GNAT family N-acetyltransferase [Eubacteriales bacterium]|nr:GNAT family N-acetyltransferase [Eubacteriales bacterium]